MRLKIINSRIPKCVQNQSLISRRQAESLVSLIMSILEEKEEEEEEARLAKGGDVFFLPGDLLSRGARGSWRRLSCYSSRPEDPLA